MDTISKKRGLIIIAIVVLSIIWVILISQLFRFNNALLSPGIHSVSRSFIKEGGGIYSVELTILTSSNDKVYAIKETIPKDIEILDRGDGVVNDNVIRWVVMKDISDITKVYKIKLNKKTKYYFSGEYVFNDENSYRISGVSTLDAKFDEDCIPKTCSELGAMCGEVNDGCGNVLYCGKCEENGDDDSDGIINANDKCPSTPSGKAVNRFGCIKPVTTKFEILEEDNKENKGISIEISKPNTGKIRFNKIEINEKINLDSYIDIEEKKIAVDSKNMPFLNQPAIITMYNVDVENPKILRDGEECGECRIILWDRDNRILEFEIEGFSVYEVVEGNAPVVLNKQQQGGGGGGGGGGSSRGDGGGGGVILTKKVPVTREPESCKPKWKCGEWSDCINGTKTRECYDENNCGTINNKPIEKDNCILTKKDEQRIINKIYYITGGIIILSIAILVLIIFFLKSRK